MTFGDKTKKEPELHEYQDKLIETGHFSIHITGLGVSKLDLMAEMYALAEEFNFKITSGNFNIYYTEGKRVEPVLKKAEHPNKDGKDSFSVKAGT